MERRGSIGFLLIVILMNLTFTAKSAANVDSLKQRLQVTQDTARLNVLLSLFDAYRDVDPDQAEKYIKEGILIAEAKGDAKWNSLLYKSYGQYFHRAGKVKEAYRTYIKSIDFARVAKNKEIEAAVLVNMGALFLDLGLFDKAAESLIPALKLLDKQEKNKKTLKDLSVCYTNLGYLNLEQKQYNEAENYFKKSLELKKQNNDLRGIALLYNNIGNVSVARNNLKEAEMYFKRALLYYEKAQVNIGKSMALNNIGGVFLKNNNTDSALFYFKRAYLIDSLVESPLGMTTSLLNIGNLYNARKQYVKSIPVLKRALFYAKGVSSLEDQKSAYIYLSTAYSSLHDFENAFKYSQKIEEINDSIYNEVSADKITRVQIQYETEKKDQQIALLHAENQLKATNLRIHRNLTWGLIGLIIFTLVVIYLIFNRMKLKQAAREAQLERNRLDVENKLLRVQMNPHFIFNSLNSIQSYISAHDTYSAELYLAKFSSLMRYILQNSTHSFVTLDEEIKILRLYLELEQQRFNNKFDFLILVADDVDEEFTEIPPMLIQPFVENSIKHGIANKQDGQGLIRIDIKAANGLLYCQVVDNGVGRAKASLLKQNIPGYKSLGMQLTGERLELLKLQSNIDVKIAITDLVDEAGMALGTEVNLQIPFTELD